MSGTQWHAPTDPTTDERGDERHPAFGSITAHRITTTLGAVLFDSDIRHQNLVRVTLGRMTRKRDLNHDWLHPEMTPLMEVDMSEAQWASFVSSMNTSAVPCTIRATETEANVPGLKSAPRLALSMAETHDAAAAAFSKIKEARDAYEALLDDKTTPAKVKREALRTLHYAIENATSGVDFAAKTLVEHTENVVQRARADIEAMATTKAQQLGISTEGVSAPFQIESTLGESA